MKAYTSRFLKTIALIYIAFPIVHICAAAVLFDIPLGLLVSILLSPSYYLVAFLASLAGYGLWEMKRWSWYLFVAVNFLIGYENAVIVNVYGATHHKVLSFLASVLILIAITYRVSKEVRVPYFFPKIRWWESDPRYKLSVPATLVRKSGEKLDGQIMDLSVTGCFVKLRVELEKDEDVSLDFTVFGYPVTCDGTVVWRTQSTVTNPKGVGIKFGMLGRTERRHLRLINRRLRKIAVLYRRSRYLLNQEEFTRLLEEIESPTYRNKVQQR